MAEQTAQDLMGYEALAQDALRGVVKAALRRAATPQGVPGGHHLYVTFKSRGAGVSIPPDLIERFPEDMTIVLQHQFWDLAPGETFFAVTLKFGGSPKRLSVPYAAVTRFYDPSVQFLLQFEEPEPVAALPVGVGSEVVSMRPRPTEVEAAAPTAEPEEGGDPPRPDGPKIVSLDTFRRK